MNLLTHMASDGEKISPDPSSKAHSAPKEGVWFKVIREGGEHDITDASMF